MSRVERKIGSHHLAFYRGWLQGLELKALADRYLETGLDLRLAKATLSWLRDSFSQAALRHGHRGEARLLRLHLSPNAQSNALSFPSLEEFRCTRDPDSFYREEELIRIYLETFPQAMEKRGRQRQRLIDRQLAALVWVERLLITVPVPNDPVTAWFDQPIAARLIASGIPTLNALLERMRERGYRWWITVPKLGEKGALRILAWLQGYEQSLGALPTHALSPVRRQTLPSLVRERHQETAIVPLEVFVIPEELSASTPSNRYLGRPRIEASNDLQAIQSWLATKAGNANTERAYRKESERLLLWAIIERGKVLSDLTVDDCAAYRDWLSALGRSDTGEWRYKVQQSAWIGRRNTPRFSPAWRPFDGPLSAASIRQALIIVSSLFEWLIRVQYCAFNPWEAVGKKISPQEAAPPDIEMTRAFSEAQWQYLKQYLEELPRDGQTNRLRFVLPFGYATGLRLSELVDAKIGRLYTRPISGTLSARWMLKVCGKGGKWRAVPIPDSILSALADYLTLRGLSVDPFANPPDTPLIARLDGNEPVTASSLYKALKALFHGAGEALRSEGRVQESKDFDRASVHWLRHTRGSHLGLAGVPPNLIQKLLGHASLATTSIYTESDEARVWQELTDLESEDAD